MKYILFLVALIGLVGMATSVSIIKTNIDHTGVGLIWVGNIIDQNNSVVQMNCTGGILIGKDGSFEKLEPKHSFNVTIMRTAILP